MYERRKNCSICGMYTIAKGMFKHQPITGPTTVVYEFCSDCANSVSLEITKQAKAHAYTREQDEVHYRQQEQQEQNVQAS